MSAANQHVFSHGMRDTRETFEVWSERPWPVLRGWIALSLAVAAALLLAGLVRRRAADSRLDAGPHRRLHLSLRARRPAADPLAQLARPRPARDRLRRRLHRRGLDADRRRAADGLLTLGPRQGGRTGDPLRRRRDPLLAVTQALYLGFQASTISSQLDITRLELVLSVLPHAIPELTALFLPLAAWLIASRRGEWNQLLAATLFTVALAIPVLIAAAALEVYVWPHILDLLSRGVRDPFLSGGY